MAKVSPKSLELFFQINLFAWQAFPPNQQRPLPGSLHEVNATPAATKTGGNLIRYFFVYLKKA